MSAGQLKSLIAAFFIGIPSLIQAMGQGRFTENLGQWNEAVHFKIGLSGGFAYLDERGLTIHQMEEGFLDKLHEYYRGKKDVTSASSHVVRFSFQGADLSRYEGKYQQKGLENYFLGTNREQHIVGVRSFDEVNFKSVYTSIDLRYNHQNGNLKYEFIVKKGGDPNDIQIDINHAESVFLRDGNLIIKNSVGELIEHEPFAYQIGPNHRIEKVACKYVLSGNRVTYYFEDGYDNEKDLIIDPEIAFSTYIGASSDNFGFTASYDNDGNLYGGAIVFGQIYPTTDGAYQVNFDGGTIDCGITKFSPDGTDLIYSTFLGGLSSEAPHSLVVNNEGELYILGTTGSIDFPTTIDAFQPNFAGGNPIAGLGFSYTEGCDIFVAKLNSEGNELLASTFIGGNENDGIGVQDDLDFNYGDIFRGEIIVSDNGDVMLASVSESLDFPLINGFSSSMNGSSNGVIIRLNASLTDMIWSASTGGNLPEAAYGLQMAPDGSVYVTGGTTSSGLAGSENGANSDYSGNVDGYLMHISGDGATILASTYIGTTEFDQTYFVQIDSNGEVYVIGQSLGDIEVSDGVYFNAGGRQFIQKFNADLSTLQWGTRIGSNNGLINFSPSAFLVTQCNDIYVSGWGGTVNEFGEAGGNTFGLPITDDAFQSTTDGSDFYLLVLEEDAQDIVYATYFGGSTSTEHVDGGTSRFDKDGTVYQAVCAGCGGLDDFPTQPGVWSQNNLSNNCNLGVFKFRLSSVSALAEVDSATDTLCTNQPTTFNNLSQDANSYFWDFGDGETSTEINPTHVYTDPGEYIVTLLAEDTDGCLGPDSTTISVEVLPSPNMEFTFDNTPICPGEQIQLSVTGADSYEWSPAAGLNNTNVFNPLFSGTETSTYTVTGTSVCGTQTLEVTLTVGLVDIEIEEDLTVCPGESIQLSASGGSQYLWTPDIYLDDPTIAKPTATPEANITYQVTVSTDDGCEGTAQVGIELLDPPPVLTGQTDYVSCNGVPVQILIFGGDNYSWSPSNGLSADDVSNPTAFPSESTVYTVTSEGECGTGSLEVTVQTNAIEIDVFVDTIACFLTPIPVEASGANTYRWDPPELFADANSPETTVSISSTTEISVIGFDESGCFDRESHLIQLYPRQIVRAGNDRIINYGDEIILESFSIFPITWEPSPYLSCLNCNDPLAFPLESTTFFATIETPDGCLETDSVNVTVTGNLYVPNSFTPDGDGINDIFKAIGIDIVEFRMEIFNRWGELIFTSQSIDFGWNGSSNSDEYYAPAGLYPYRIVATDHTGQLFELAGGVNLIR